MQGVMYYNPGLAHQVDHAKAFEKCGFMISHALQKPAADVSVISGPHYAYDAVKNHKNVLMIDRAFWGDPDCVSIGWLQPDGSRKFASGDAPRPKPELRDWKPVAWGPLGEIRCIVLADYGQDCTEVVKQASKHFASVGVRVHPANCDYRRAVTLEDDVKWADVVVGHSGTAVFTAIRHGTPCIVTDPNNPCRPVCSAMGEPLYRGDREEWLHSMSYKQFSIEEIANGTAWKLLKEAM